MTDMISRVAQALEAEYLAIAAEAMKGGVVGFSRTDADHRRLARKAIEAMRAPTAEMIAARFEVLGQGGQVEWEAMIERALKP